MSRHHTIGVPRPQEAGPVLLFVPCDLPMRDILPNSLHRHIDCAYYIIHCVIQGMIHGHETDAGYVPLNWMLLRKYFSNGGVLCRVRDALIHSGVLITDGTFAEGSKSTGYAIGPEFIRNEPDWHTVEDSRLAGKLRRWRDGEEEALTALHRSLRDELYKLSVDESAANAWYADLEANGTFKPRYRFSLEAVRKKAIKFTVAESGRCYSTITGMKREGRSVMRFEDEPLWEIDLVNGQPLLFSIMLRERFGTSPPRDVARYIRLVQRGTLYEFLMARGGVRLGDFERKRAAFKVEVFSGFMFCEIYEDGRCTRMHRIFLENFPTIAAYVEELKRDDHKAVARLLQSAEAAIMIGRVARRCLTEFRGGIVITLHDAIIVVERHVKQARSIVREEFAADCLLPGIHVEPLCRLTRCANPLVLPGC